MNKIKIYRKKYTGWLLLGLLAAGLSACKKLVEIPPPDTELNAELIFKDESTAKAAIASIYGQLSTGSSFASGGNQSVTYFEGLYADELNSFAASNTTSDLPAFYLNNVGVSNGTLLNTWGGAYKVIYGANCLIEGVGASGALSSSLKDELTGEALFLRAFCHFYLANLFGDVPLVLSSDYRQNTLITRTPVAEVYAAVTADLLRAKALLPTTYPSAGRVRVNKGAATALLARVYLYQQKWTEAETAATEVISDVQYDLESDLDQVFVNTSKEAIWQLLPGGGNESYAYEGFYFILQAPPAGGNVTLRADLVGAFESGDLRKKQWVDSLSSTSGLTKWYFAHKYKQSYLTGDYTEYSMVIRLAELYLIRAEARMQQGKLTGVGSAAEDLNILRSRVQLPGTGAESKAELQLAIEKERRLELFTEWGHRFFDLKRTGRLDELLGPVKGNWNKEDALLPLPLSEILANPKLTQNAGY